ncbi:PREDICTED: uncharacterized protein LOC105592342 [Cercocebus atys]|uniref:uncharacterized protein LOC105592342 n=1 Tax=Cercocebus atys TaxID=9531 RepID=UPI0005F46087|nr:PREDICTED: uncharacterized protein LOC105592342 [Cercocebus atys]
MVPHVPAHSVAAGTGSVSWRLACAWLLNKPMGPQPSHEQTLVGRSRADQCSPLGQVSGGTATALTSLLQQLQTVTRAAKGLTVRKSGEEDSAPVCLWAHPRPGRSHEAGKGPGPGALAPTGPQGTTGSLNCGSLFQQGGRGSCRGKWKEPSHWRTRHGGLQQAVTPKAASTFPAQPSHQASVSPREEAAVGAVAVAELGGPNQKGRKDKTTTDMPRRTVTSALGGRAGPVNRLSQSETGWVRVPTRWVCLPVGHSKRENQACPKRQTQQSPLSLFWYFP